jgi:hypothetical protein
MNTSPQGAVEEEVERLFPGSVSYDVQPLGKGVFTAMIFADDGPDGDIQASAVALFQFRAVLIGEPVILTVAQRDG